MRRRWVPLVAGDRGQRLHADVHPLGRGHARDRHQRVDAQLDGHRRAAVQGEVPVQESQAGKPVPLDGRERGLVRALMLLSPDRSWVVNEYRELDRHC